MGVAIEIMFSFVAVGTAISLPVSIMDNTKVARKSRIRIYKE